MEVVLTAWNAEQTGTAAPAMLHPPNDGESHRNRAPSRRFLRAARLPRYARLPLLRGPAPGDDRGTRREREDTPCVRVSGARRRTVAVRRPFGGRDARERDRSAHPGGGRAFPPRRLQHGGD